METSIKAGADAYFNLAELKTEFAEAPAKMPVSKIGTTQVPTSEAAKVPTSEPIQLYQPSVNLDVDNGAATEEGLKGSLFNRWI